MSSGPSTEHGIRAEPPEPGGPGTSGSAGPNAAEQPSTPTTVEASAASATEVAAPAPAAVVTAPDGHAPAAAAAEPSDGQVPPAGAPASDGGTHKQRSRRGNRSFLQELPFLLLVAFVLALLIKSFLVQAFYIPSESMVPTLKVGDRVLVNKLTYRFHPPRRGDIIVFQDPHPPPQEHQNPVTGFFHWLGEGLGLSTSKDKDFIKRVIGLPGDTVQIKVVNGVGVTYVNGVPLKEPYLSPIKETRPFGPVTVPKDQLFVMGDNRTDSNDSRYGLGMIPMDKVVGRAFVIIWPPSRIRWLSGVHYPGL